MSSLGLIWAGINTDSSLYTGVLANTIKKNQNFLLSEYYNDDVIFNIPEGGLELIFFVLEWGTV